MDAFTEDWNASQFWVSICYSKEGNRDVLIIFGRKYADETAEALARQLLDGATAETRIAVVSAPSVFIQIKNVLVS